MTENDVYIYPIHYKCPKCGNNLKCSGSHNWTISPKSVRTGDPICPVCWEYFLVANLPVMERVTEEKPQEKGAREIKETRQVPMSLLRETLSQLEDDWYELSKDEDGHYRYSRNERAFRNAIKDGACPDVIAQLMDIVEPNWREEVCTLSCTQEGGPQP